MKSIIFLLLLFASIEAYCQMDSLESKRSSDSLTSAISRQLKINSEKIKEVFTILSTAMVKMDSVARNRQTSKEQKDVAIRDIAQQRDRKLESILTSEQVLQLQKIFATIKRKKANQTSTTH